jgi:hypothetical protein
MFADAVKLKSGCADCAPGTVWPAIALDFDHIPGTWKRATVAALITSGTEDDFRAEIAKCEVVCANHHRIRTAARVAGPPRAAVRRPRRRTAGAPA